MINILNLYIISVYVLVWIIIVVVGYIIAVSLIVYAYIKTKLHGVKLICAL